MPALIPTASISTFPLVYDFIECYAAFNEVPKIYEWRDIEHPGRIHIHCGLAIYVDEPVQPLACRVHLPEPSHAGLIEPHAEVEEVGE